MGHLYQIYRVIVLWAIIQASASQRMRKVIGARWGKTVCQPWGITATRGRYAPWVAVMPRDYLLLYISSTLFCWLCYYITEWI